MEVTLLEKQLATRILLSTGSRKLQSHLGFCQTQVGLMLCLVYKYTFAHSAICPLGSTFSSCAKLGTCALLFLPYRSHCRSCSFCCLFSEEAELL